MSNGFFSIQGIQTLTAANSRQGLGPFNVPFGGLSDTQTVTLTAGTTSIGCTGNGMAIIPPIGSPPVGVTMKIKTVPGDSGTFISTQQPTILEWDVTNAEVPSTLYVVVAGGTITVVFQTL